MYPGVIIDWKVILAFTIYFVLFLVSGIIPFRRREKLAGGMWLSFVIALYVEMFGLPLTLFVLSSLGQSVTYAQSHLIVFALHLDPVGRPYMLIQLLSRLLMISSIALIFFGWRQIWKAKGRLVTDGLYGSVRHPQYLGLILFITGLILYRATLLTIPMGMFMIAGYVWLTKKEERKLIKRFGDRYVKYKKAAPMMIPSFRGPLKIRGIEWHELLLLLGLCWIFIVHLPEICVRLLGPEIFTATRPYVRHFAIPLGVSPPISTYSFQ